jgi:hypothetical protein
MTHLLAFFAGTLAGVLILSIVAAGADDTSRAQGPQTPPVDPNDPTIEVHGI